MDDATVKTKITSAWFQFAWMFITVVMIGGTLFFRMKSFIPLDPMPSLSPLLPQAVEELGSIPGRVKVGLSIKDFPDFTILKNEFVFTGIIWFEFDPSIISLETVSKFSFEKGEILKLSEPNTRLIGDKLFVSYTTRVRFKSDNDHSFFPFDSHRVYIVLDNIFVSPGEIIFDSSNADFIVPPSIFTVDWYLYDRHVYTGYTTTEFAESGLEQSVSNPRVVFELDYLRRDIRKGMTIFLPLLLLFFVILFSFTIDPASYAIIMSISGVCVTSLLAYRFVIENLAPSTGYFMISDIVFLLLLGLVCIVFFCNVNANVIGRRAKELITLIAHAAVMGTFIYVLYFWKQ